MKINPLNFFDRKIDSIPPHFVTTSLYTTDYQTETSIDKWIYENCFGRYSITKDVIYQGDQSRSITVLGFENPGDLSLFALSGKAQINQK